MSSVEIASISNRLKVTLLGEDEPGGSGLDGVFFPLADELGFRVYDRPFLVPTGLSCSSMPPMLQANFSELSSMVITQVSGTPAELLLDRDLLASVVGESVILEAAAYDGVGNQLSDSGFQLVRINRKRWQHR